MNIIIKIKDDFDLGEAKSLLEKEGVTNIKVLENIGIVTGRIDITYMYEYKIKSLDFF